MTSEEQAKALIEAISLEAKSKWGDDWIASLTRAYCEIESEETGKLIKPPQRRSQLGRIFEEGNTTLPTLIRLLRAVEAEIKLTVTRKETKSFS